jgi:glycerate kinase
MAKILIAPDSFKGSATSVEVAQALAIGWQVERPSDEILELPFADGGEGTLDAIYRAIPNATQVPIRVRGASGVEHVTNWLLINGDTAIIELARVCGMATIKELDPLGAHSFGLGQVIMAALDDLRVNEILVAVGGSASTDAGLGALSALGYKAFDGDGKNLLLGGGSLSSLARIEAPSYLRKPSRGIKVLVDVQSPLTGIHGAAYMFAPQKGANVVQVKKLENGLQHFLEILDAKDQPGFGAAGGVPSGLALLLGAGIISGVEKISELIGVEKMIRDSDCVITGEGSFDSQSFFGKAVGYLIKLSHQLNREIFIACGVNQNEPSPKVLSLVELAPSIESAMLESEHWLVECGKVLASRFHN